MATLEKQLATISNLFAEALARTIRLVQYHANAQGKPDSVAQLEWHIASQNCPQLAQLLNYEPINGSKATLNERWLAESLSAADAALRNIQPRAVRAYRWRRRSTEFIFETHIRTAQQNFSDPISGVTDSIDKCFSNPQQYQTEGIEELAELSNLAGKLQRRIKILGSPILSPVYSPRLWIIVSVVLLASIPIGYYTSYGQRLSFFERLKVECE
jgi:hypothetical protein